MSSKTVTVIIKGVPHYFSGDELTSPAQQAILFLQELDYLEVDF
mgnify:CR=1 FL=1|tara:strand:- start:799 stop:930 length:132 start_codon:yes stop_codon:yes gene_type:complete